MLFAAVILIALAAPPAALGQKVNAPAGNSGISQYVEVVPVAAGNKPSAHSRSSSAAAQIAQPQSPARQDVGRERPDSRDGSASPKAAPGLRPSSTDVLLARFVAGSTPSTERDQSALDRMDDAGSSSALKVLVGAKASTGLGIALPLLMLASAIAAFAIARRSRRHPPSS